MEYYTDFAYFTMFTLLFLLIRSALQVHFWLKACDVEILAIKAKLKEKTWLELRHHDLFSGVLSVSKEELCETSFAPVVAKLKHVELFSSIAPTAGMFFTLTSFILAAQSFADGGSVHSMFKAVSVGMGTTAVAACILILSKLMLSRLERKFNRLLNAACTISLYWHKKIEECKRQMNLKRAS